MSNAKIAAALVGGYVLGRTKKAKAAIGVALWLTGRNHDPKDVLRDQAVKLLKSPQGEQLLAQVRGPVVEASRRAALSVYEAQVERLTENLQQRTQQFTETLTEKGGTTAKAAAGAVSDVLKTVPGAGGKTDEQAPAGQETDGGPGDQADGTTSDQADSGPGDQTEESDQGPAEAEQEEAETEEQGPDDGDEGRRPAGRAPAPDRGARRRPLMAEAE
ncbi:hypothetical protein FF36_02358 [Frankia torreyi]|uniref:Uncharacterized protein n=1 Tax=Frankia torreyi TaxID=1856 RepID=A0A0D8BH61_9ACTN|nr:MULTISPECIES: hypothetical protein [Frankia]KJE23400.1 hypothetical protein FF36_02358 [Frankia torreyi]KQC36499.1 hypothetical protein UK82_20980 [Frankia sp. ACN1ag]KQM05439.1 hypothetical protein FF86_1016111 [Frankia sp. CpI1-P]